MASGEILGGRYRLDEHIGEGGMARVYRAEDLALERTVAVKIMRTAADPSARRRARTETSLLAALTHPSVVTVYDAHIAADEPSYLVMEYVDGRTLRDRLDDGPAPPELVAVLGMDLAEALHAVHDHGMVHRDIKPSNVLLWASPLPDRAFRAKLTDFGIACLLDATRVTSPGTVVGTAAYLAPEQVRGEPPAPSADVYSLGLVLLEALTARPAFGEAVGPEAIVARLTTSPAVPEDLPDGWRELLIAMTAANPTRRPTALQVAVACGELRAAPLSTGAQLRPLIVPQEAWTDQTTAPMDAPAGAGAPQASAHPRTEPLPLPGGPAAPRRGRRTGASAAIFALVLAAAVGVGFAAGGSPPAPVLPDVGGLLGAHLGERLDVEAPAVDPAEPVADTGGGTEVAGRGAGDEVSAGNPNRGPGNNSGSSSDANSGKGSAGNGNGNNGNGNGNGNNGNGNSGKGKGNGG